MKAAVIHSFDQPPTYGDFREPAPAGPDEVLIHVRAAALSNLVRGQASGRHYSAGSELPFIPGNDGVGTTPDGRRVYFVGARSPFGSMAELSVIRATQTIPLPEALDDVKAAALGNPGLATWGSLLGRAHMQPGETVLINGATGAAGQQAIQVARYLGAKAILATGRDETAFARLRELGADQTISLRQSDEDLTQAFRDVLHQHGVDIILDYLWGPPAAALLKACAGTGSRHGEPRRRFIQIGSIAGPTVPLDATILRSSGLELLGSGLGSLSASDIIQSLSRMYEAAATTEFAIETEAVPLHEVASRWNQADSNRRLVFTI